MLEKIKENKRKLIIIGIILLVIIAIITITIVALRVNKNNKIKQFSKAEEEYSYNKPYIPQGFTHTEGEWNTGFVIKEDATGNEFVWIPVDGSTVTLERKSYSVSEVDYSSCTEELDETFSESVEKYQGYYVARYEVGVPSTLNIESDDDLNVNGKPVSKKNTKIWNYISYTNAKTSAEQMYVTKSEITSSLMNSYAYDTMLRWIEASGYNVETDSKDWGNYTSNNDSTNQVENSGSNETWKANNIYDIAGNVGEWTSEQSNGKYIIRGGSYYNDGNVTPAGMREVGNEDKTANNIGFRPILYKTGNPTITGYDDPYIPKGFTHTEGEWNTGFVIKEDATGNEFVWIPIDGYNLELDRTEFEDTFTSMMQSTDNLQLGFKLSVYTYGGYYIGRYEAGIGETSGDNVGIPVCKPGVDTWTNISRTNAKKSAEKMYESNSEISSKLMSGYAYDTILNWLNKKDYSVNTYNIDTDSSQWGNYKNNSNSTGEKAKTGSNESWKANNIYDLAGNVWEWTTEDYKGEVIARGGDYLSNGDVLPATARDHVAKSNTSDYTGFRVIMYKASGNPNAINKPKLAKGMTPVKWDGQNWIETTEDDEEWYDYDNKIWANVKLEDGSMFVWIPRYAYNIKENWHTSNVKNIDIKFLKQDRNETLNGEKLNISNESGENKWLIPPAFTYGDTEVAGIWIGKYLAKGSDRDNISIIEGRNIYNADNIGNAYDICIDINKEGNIYGLDSNDDIVDPHLIKNSEWGAMMYITHSKYGRNSGVSKIADITYTTTKPEDSTTGNETGIYDTNYFYAIDDTTYHARIWTNRRFYHGDLIAAYVQTKDEYLTTFGGNLLNAPSKHKDVYDVAADDTAETNYNINSNIYGDAIYETSMTGKRQTTFSASIYPNSTNPFFYRSEYETYMFMSTGSITNQANTSSVKYINGKDYSTRTVYTYINGFRPSIVVY